MWVWDSSPPKSPSSLKALTTAFLASKRSIPRKASGAFSPMVASGVMTSRRGTPLRWAISKSLGSWAGVTFTIPGPNSRST